MSLSDQQQRAVRDRGVAVVGCVMAVSVALPAVSMTYDTRRVEAEFRDQAVRLANAQTAREGLETIARSPLIDHPWLVSVEYALEREGDVADPRYGERYRDAAALYKLASFEPRHIQKAEAAAAEQQCLAEAIYYEARSEGPWGRMAVAEVIMNRVKDYRYPDTVCGVVYQGSERSTGCQFTFTCDGALRAKPRGVAWREAQVMASHVLMGLNKELTGGATHYHTNYVNPVWNTSLIETRTIGTHIFYRFPRTGPEWAAVRDRQENRVAGVVLASAKAKDTERAPTILPADEAKPATTSVISTEAAPAP